MNVLATRTTRKQSGVALIAFLLVFVTAASFALLKGLNEVATKHYRDAQTAKALAEAKAALLGRAAGGNIVEDTSCTRECRRPGDLPCPDMNNDGLNNDGSCNPENRRLGRLPWKTLGLPDLRDGSGERLWYAISSNFKNNNRTECEWSGVAGCLNSDSRGTLTVRNSNGGVLHDGSNPDKYVPSGAIAILLAPGGILQRQDAGTAQDRSCATCNDPKNYLDIDVENGQDNADFADESPTDGFIQGDIFDASQNVIVNDKILAITYEDIMPLLEWRVVGEVLACLREYATSNNQRYPWAAKADDWPVVFPPYSNSPTLSDELNLRFGRLPDNPLNDTEGSIGGLNSAMWPTGDCKLTSTVSPNTWWLNWKEHVFYAVAEAYQPAAGSPSPCGPSPNSCLTVNPPSLTSDRRAVVMVAGKKLAAVLPDILVDQVRDNANQKGIVNNYLEGENADDPPGTYDNSFTSGPATATFNDVTCNNGNCL